MERANNAALEDRPKAFNRVGMNRANNILALGVINGSEWICLFQPLVSAPIVGREQANLVGYHFAHEVISAVFAVTIRQNAGDDVALALHRADDRQFCR